MVPLRPSFPVSTARLRLRPLVPADVDSVVAYRSRPEVCRYVPFEPMDREAVADRVAGRWARQEIVAEGDALFLGVEVASSNQVVGDVMLSLTSAEHRGGEVGWVLNPDHSGQGYATEAAHAMLHLAFDGLGLHRVAARVDARNDPSLRLAARLGMRREAHLLANEWFKGEWGDEVDFALLEDEWEAQHQAGNSTWCGIPGQEDAEAARSTRLQCPLSAITTVSSSTSSGLSSRMTLGRSTVRLSC
ncbi:MAG: GNAT family N-acetyltransferase [Vulcanimicrobiaceae bacterium]